MIMQDWIIPAILAAVILDAGIILAARLRRQSGKTRARQPLKQQDQTQTSLRQLVQQAKMGGPLLVGGAVTLASTRILNPMLAPEVRWTAAPFLTMGGIFILSGAYPFAFGRRIRLDSSPFARLGRWLGIKSGGLLTIGAALAFAILAALASNHGIRAETTKVASVFWGLGILLLVLGVSRADEDAVRPTWRLVLGMSVLTCVAFLLRGTATSRIPAILSGDEGLFGSDSARVLSGEVTNPFAAGTHTFPTLFLFLQSVPILLLGNTAQAIRILSALAGTLTVGAVYMLGRSMFGHKAGMWAAVLLAFSDFHIHFSRLGLNNIWDGLWYVFALGGLWHGWKTGRRTSFILAGLSLGLGQYFYATSRLLLVILPLWLLVAWRSDRRRFREALPDLLLMILAGIVVTLPLAWYYAKNLDVLLGLARSKSLFGPWIRAEAAMTGLPPALILYLRLLRGFGAYVSAPLNGWYQPGSPMLQGGSVVLFLAGLVFIALRYRDARGAMLTLWLIAFGLLGGLTESTPAAQRYIPAIVAALLVAGLGLAQSESLASKLWPRGKQLFAVLSVLLASWLALRNLNFYFFIYNLKFDFDGVGAFSSQQIVNYVKENPEVDQIIFFGNERDPGPNPNLYYLAPQVDVLRMVGPWGSPANPRPTGQDLLFAFLKGSEDNLPAIMQSYPGGATDYEANREGGLLVALYEAHNPGH